jgi:hypothetical protein
MQRQIADTAVKAMRNAGGCLSEKSREAASMHVSNRL